MRGTVVTVGSSGLSSGTPLLTRLHLLHKRFCFSLVHVFRHVPCFARGSGPGTTASARFAHTRVFSGVGNSLRCT